MSKRVAIVAVMAIALLAAPTAFAMPNDGVTGPAYAAKAFCPSGTMVAYVTQNVRNAADRGLAGNVWALADYTRYIAVIQTGPATYCAALTYVSGSFTTTGNGPSPGLSSRTLRSGISGIIGGGYRTTTFIGTWAPSVPTSGSIGTYDYGCDASGDCPGYVDWTSLFFSSTVGFTANWWGWIYSTSANGLWVQRADITYGDIRN
jgi:hypothetical protein